MIAQEVFYHFGGREPELLVVEVAGTVTPGLSRDESQARPVSKASCSSLSPCQDTSVLLSVLPPVLFSLRKRSMEDAGGTEGSPRDRKTWKSYILHLLSMLTNIWAPPGAVFKSIISSCPTVPWFSGHLGLGPIPLTCPQRVAGASNFLHSKRDKIKREGHRSWQI